MEKTRAITSAIVNYLNKHNVHFRAVLNSVPSIVVRFYIFNVEGYDLYTYFR